MTKENKTYLSFAAINQYVESNIPNAEEKEIRGQSFIGWGDDNKYPVYLFNLYKSVPTLQSLINGCVDYLCGISITSLNPQISDKKLGELIYDMALSYYIFGGFALSVTRNKVGGIYNIECLDIRNVRSNKNNEVLYYSEDFNTKSYGRAKCVVYPKFGKDDINNANSIYFYKNTKYQVYPLPIWGASVIAAEIEKSIDEYHLNNINNNFTGSVMVSLCNGVPDDEVKEEIERNFQEKFTGKENSGRVVISYADDKDHAASIEQIDTEDFSDRYNALAERSRQALLTSFRATPILFGIDTNNKGFARQEYQDAYVLFYNTVIKPMQNEIISIIEEIYGTETVNIEPFKLEFETGTIEDTNI